VLLNQTYYHYCDIDSVRVDAFEAAESMGRYFNASIKGHFDCLTGRVPSYRREDFSLNLPRAARRFAANIAKRRNVE
jgi:KTSC domain